MHAGTLVNGATGCTYATDPAGPQEGVRTRWGASRGTRDVSGFAPETSDLASSPTLNTPGDVLRDG